MTLEVARVADVTEVRAGSELSADFVATNTLLTLYVTTDFSDVGGQVEIDGDVYDYETKDVEAGTLTLVNGLLRDMPADTQVWVFPESLTKVAIVEMDQEVDQARVPHNLLGSIEAMVRDGYDQESVILEQMGNTWVIKDVFAEQYKLQGEYIPPETLPASDSGPTTPPASSPTLSLSGSKDAITAVAHGIIDPTTTLDYYLDGVLMESTRSTVMVFRTDSAGNPLVKDTEYDFYVVARNVIDSAAPSPTVTGQLNPAVDSDAILAVVTAGFALLGSLEIGGITIKPPSGSDPTAPGYDPGGIIIPLTTGGEIRFPADGSQAIIEAALRTADLIVSGGLAINGQTNYVNGTLFLGSGTPDPTTPTVIGSTIITKDLKFLSATGQPLVYTPYNYHRGLAKATNGKYAIISVGSSNGALKLLRIIDPATNRVVAEIDSDTEVLDFRSVTAIGNKFYVLGHRWNASAAESQWRLQVYNDNAVNTGEGRWLESTTGARLVPITYWDSAIAADPDGVHVWCARSQSNGKVGFYKYTAADPGSNLEAVESHVSADVVGATVLHGAYYVGNGDFGAKRHALHGTYSGQYQIKVFNPTTWVEDLTQSWFDGWWAGGMIFDGGVFKTLDYNSTDGAIVHFARVGSVSSLANTVVAKHAWWDNNGVDGNKESAASAVATKILPMREWPTLTVPPPPNTGSADNPANSVRIYLAQTEAALKLHQTIQPAAGQQIRSQTTITAKTLVGTGTEVPKAATSFPVASSSGSVQSVNADGVGALAKMLGDGSWRLGDLQSDGTAGRFKMLKTSYAALPAGGTYTGDLTLVRIGQWVFAKGYVDRASGFNASSHDTGHRIPVGFRPTGTETDAAKPAWNTTFQYRYRFFAGATPTAAGIVEIQQTGAIGTFQVIDTKWATADA